MAFNENLYFFDFQIENIFLCKNDHNYLLLDVPLQYEDVDLKWLMNWYRIKIGQLIHDLVYLERYSKSKDFLYKLPKNNELEKVDE